MSTSKLDSKKIEVAKKVQELGGDGAADFYGIPRSTFKDYLRRNNLPTTRSDNAIKADSEEGLLKENLKLTQRIKEYERDSRKVEKEEIFSERVTDAIEKSALTRDTKYKPAKYEHSKGDTEHEMALMWSDAHAGEVVDYEEMNGINEYNWDIMLQRHDKIRKSLFSYQDNRTYPVKKLNLWALGDNVSGNIHDELIETNEVPLAEAAMQFALDSAEWVESLLEGFEEIEISGVSGNHARFTREKKSKTGGFDNVDWMIYKTMESILKKNDRIKFNISKSSMYVTQIYGRNILLWHGDGVRSSMPGVPWGGVVRRSNNLQNQYSAIGKPLYMLAVGHFHQLNLVHSSAGIVAMNGAIVGGNEYSLKNFGHSDSPQQQLLTFHPTKGLTDSSIIDLK